MNADEQTPSHDLTAEQNVLGAIMLREDIIPDVFRVFGEDGAQFYRPAHQLIYAAALAVYDRGEAPDATLVAAELLKRGEIGRVGGAPYLHTLISEVPTAANAAHYAAIVDGRAEDRALQTLSTRLAQASNEGHHGRAQELIGEYLEQRATQTPDNDGPRFVLLNDFLAVEDEPVRHRIEGLWPIGGRIVNAAAYKAGKTTMRDNVVRALVDKQDFLGSFAVAPPAGRVAIIDNELDERMLRRWLRDQRIENEQQVAVLPLRGKTGTFDLLDRATRTSWAKRLRAVDAEIVILDCLRPVLDALGLSEDKDAGRFLVAFDALLDEAGVAEGLVNHHMGHNGERSRGDSRILDWPDATWMLVRERGENGEAAPANARRYFSAYGRDVDVPEGLLSYDRDRRRLVLEGGNRRETAADAAIPDIVAYLNDNPGASGRAIEGALSPHPYKRAVVRTAVRRAITQELVDTGEGPKRATLHFARLDPSAPSAPEVRQRTREQCASAPIGRTAHSLPEEDQCAAAHSDDEQAES